jgi:hypothetical protein
MVSGYDIWAFHCPQLCVILRGLHRQKRHLVCQAQPITSYVLKLIMQSSKLSSVTDLVFWTLSLFAF